MMPTAEVEPVDQAERAIRLRREVWTLWAFSGVFVFGLVVLAIDAFMLYH